MCWDEQHDMEQRNYQLVIRLYSDKEYVERKWNKMLFEGNFIDKLLRHYENSLKT